MSAIETSDSKPEAPSFLENALPDKHCALLARNVLDVIGLPSDSASPTDTWILVLYDQKSSRIVNAFMKFFVNVPRTKHDPGTVALVYEMKVYDEVVKPLVDHDVSSHFVYTYDVSESCTFQTLAEILSRSKTFSALEAKYQVPREELAEELLERNLLITQAAIFRSWKRGVKKAKRPAITHPKPDLDKIMSAIDSKRMPKTSVRRAKFGYILNETMGGAQTVAEWISPDKGKPPPYREVLVMTFQVVTAMNALANSLCEHNDTHLGNIYLVDAKSRGQPNFNFEYIVGPSLDKATSYRLLAPFSAKLYDFDFAYCVRLGPNLRFEGICDGGKNCNRFFPNRDTTKFASAIFSEFAEQAGIPMLDSDKYDRLSGEEKARRARKFPKSKIPRGLYALMEAFAKVGNETPSELAWKTEALISAFMEGIFLSRIAVIPSDYADKLNEIGLRDLPHPEKVLENLAGLLEKVEARLPPEDRMFSRGPYAARVDRTGMTVSRCTRDRFDPNTGVLIK